MVVPILGKAIKRANETADGRLTSFHLCVLSFPVLTVCLSGIGHTPSCPPNFCCCRVVSFEPVPQFRAFFEYSIARNMLQDKIQVRTSHEHQRPLSSQGPWSPLLRFDPPPPQKKYKTAWSPPHATHLHQSAHRYALQPPIHLYPKHSIPHHTSPASPSTQPPARPWCLRPDPFLTTFITRSVPQWLWPTLGATTTQWWCPSAGYGAPLALMAPTSTQTLTTRAATRCCRLQGSHWIRWVAMRGWRSDRGGV